MSINILHGFLKQMIFFQEDSTSSEEEENLKIVNKREVQRETQLKKTFQHDRQTLNYNQATGDLSLTRDSVSLSYESSSQEKVVDEVQIQITQRANKVPKFVKKSDNDDLALILPPKPQIPTKPTCSFIRPVIKGI